MATETTPTPCEHNGNPIEAGSSPCTPEARHLGGSPNPDRITREHWNKTHQDFKTIINGQHCILRVVAGKGTCLVPVEIEEI